MSVMDRLTNPMLRTSDKILAWLLVIFGYVTATTMSLDKAGWDDPVFHRMRLLPGTPYSWAGLLFVAVTIYTVGELIAERGRGRIIIIGAGLCSLWWLGMSLTMIRMVYELPNRITDLWPVVAFVLATIYASRVIMYSNMFTGVRWTTNPDQLWLTTSYMIISLAQVVIGISSESILVELRAPVAAQMAATNFLAAAVVLVGLHLKNRDAGLNLEMFGGIALFFTLSWYVVGVLLKQPLAGTTMSFGLTEAFALGTLHRSIQIIAMHVARFRGKPVLEYRLALKLRPDHLIDERDAPPLVTPTRPWPDDEAGHDEAGAR